MEHRTKKKSLRKRKKKIIMISAVSAAFLVLLIVIILLATRDKTVTRISLDVNPGIELMLDKKQKVIEVSAVNSESRVIVEGLEKPKGQLVYPILESLVENLAAKGYLSDSPAEMLITVADDNDERSGLLKTYIKADLEKFFETNQLSVTLLLRTVEWEDKLLKDAETRGVTIGKAALLEEILDKNPLLDGTQLLSLPLGDLYALSEAEHPELPVTREAALEAVAAYALGENAVPTDSLTAEITFDAEKTPAIYTVKLDLSALVEGGTVETYTVNAYTGVVLSGKKAEPTAEPSVIDAEAAKAAALQAAGLTEDQVTELTVEKDMEDCDEADPVEVYEVSFVRDGVKYDYTLSALDGSVLKFESEPVESATETEIATETEKESEKTTQKTVDIGINAAEAAALKHAKFSSDQVSGLSAKRSTENGKTVYEVAFKKDNTVYEYTIDASTGKVIKHETETKPDDIGMTAAQTAALKHAGFSESEVSELSVLKTTSDGKNVYKVVFTMDNEKNIVIVSASGGEIIRYDTEPLSPKETETESETEAESESESETETEENPESFAS